MVTANAIRRARVGAPVSTRDPARDPASTPTMMGKDNTGSI